MCVWGDLKKDEVPEKSLRLTKDSLKRSCYPKIDRHALSLPRCLVRIPVILIMSAATSAVTVKLLSGDLLEIEIRPEETYLSFYRLLHESLPEEIRPLTYYQLTLLLGEDLVPLTNQKAILSYDQPYLLLIDTYYYRIELDSNEDLARALDLNRQIDYDAFRVRINKVETKEQEDDKLLEDIFEEENTWILYDKFLRKYRDCEGIDVMWDMEDNGYEFIEFHLPVDKPYYTHNQLIDYLVDRYSTLLSPSLAGLRHMRTQFEKELETLEKWLSSPTIGEALQMFHRNSHEDEEEEETHWNRHHELQLFMQALGDMNH